MKYKEMFKKGVGIRGEIKVKNKQKHKQSFY